MLTDYPTNPDSLRSPTTFRFAFDLCSGSTDSRFMDLVLTSTNPNTVKFDEYGNIYKSRKSSPSVNVGLDLDYSLN